MRVCYARLWAFSNCNRLRGAPAEAGALADLHDAARRSGRIASFLQQNDAVDVSDYPRLLGEGGRFAPTARRGLVIPLPKETSAVGRGSIHTACAAR